MGTDSRIRPDIGQDSRGQDNDIDHVIIVRMQAGDRMALAELYDRYASQMLGVAYNILNDRRDAEDLLHDLFVEIWNKAKTYDAKKAKVSTWLFLRLRSRAVDRVRKLAVAKRFSMAKAENKEISFAEDPNHLADQLWVKQIMNRLPDRDRIVIEFSYFKGLSCNDIAEHMQIPLGTVKSRLTRGLARLRREFVDVELGHG